MKLILPATTVIIFLSFSCLPSHKLLAIDIPVAGNAIETSKNTAVNAIPATGPAIDGSHRKPKIKQVAYVATTPRTRQRKKASARQDQTPRFRSTTYTSNRERIQIKKTRRPARTVPKIPSIPQNFPIRRG